MNKINNLQRRVVVLAGSYTRANLRKALKNGNIGQVHHLISDLLNYPETNDSFRVELELREKTNPGNFIRPADLFDLVRFASLHPELILEHGPVEGFDFSSRYHGKRNRYFAEYSFCSIFWRKDSSIT